MEKLRAFIALAFVLALLPAIPSLAAQPSCGTSASVLIAGATNSAGKVDMTVLNAELASAPGCAVGVPLGQAINTPTLGYSAFYQVHFFNATTGHYQDELLSNRAQAIHLVDTYGGSIADW